MLRGWFETGYMSYAAEQSGTNLSRIEAQRDIGLQQADKLYEVIISKLYQKLRS